jgi:hypothetical protein
VDTTTSVVATSGIVLLGRWAEGKQLDVKIIVGASVLTIGLAIMASANEKFAEQFALLLLVTAALRYVIPITKKLPL